jgi:hypothetical protein
MNMIMLLGKRQYKPATGPGVAVGAAGGYTLTVNGIAGATYPQNRIPVVKGTVRALARAGALGAHGMRSRLTRPSTSILASPPRHRRPSLSLRT